MARLSFNVDGMYCYECSQALKRFLGGLKGILGVEAEGGRVVVEFDDRQLKETEVKRIVSDTIERLGYRLS
ncbi:MAG: copper chaperone [Nitrospirae bacterium]|nr:MAG: copper chaperone [Nitrospirota bacterium]